jgi:hypothetical protein
MATVIGGLYSRNYLQNDTLVQDSARFRKRIGAFFNQKLDRYNDLCGKTILRDLGVELKISSVRGTIVTYQIAKFLEQTEIRDVLDSITIIYQISNSDSWKECVENAFRDEGLNYTLDEKCGVHLYVDAQFQQNKSSTLRCLQKEGLDGVKHEFEQAFDNLRQKNNKGAIKSINEAVEALAKNMADIKEANLDKAMPKLLPIIEEIYKKDIPLKDASKAMQRSLIDWNTSCHQYRHGKDADKINNPSDEYTILMLSQGAAYIRWLLDVEHLYITQKNHSVIA